MTVPTAAPTRSSLGAPSLPKIKTQLKKMFRKKAPAEPISGMFTLPVLRSR